MVSNIGRLFDKKRNGFTLVELLAVIVILAIVLIIAVPGVLGIINKTKNNAYESQLKIIKEAAKNYIMEARDVVVWKENQTVVSLTEIQNRGLLEKKILDPRDKSELKHLAVVITKKENLMDYDIVYTDPSDANYPRLSNNMIPIVYKEDKWVKADLTNENQSWFDYSKQQWANIATVTEDVRQTLLDAPVGSEIPMEKINTMFTWIPRYRYKLWNVDGTLLPTSNSNLRSDYEIDVQFETVETTKSMGTQNGQWLTHPAFTLGNQEVSGLWVSKYVVGYNQGTDLGTYTQANARNDELDASKIIVKPNVYSWTDSRLYTVFYNARNMKNPGNVFGFSEEADTHLLKNNEWGAIGYLTYSKYGKAGNSAYSGSGKEVAINSMNTSVTGCGTAIFTGVCESYETKNGQAASTTGNITGIYDMVGNVWEYVASIMLQPDNMHAEVTATMFSQEELDALIAEGKYMEAITYSSDWQIMSQPTLGDGLYEMRPVTLVNDDTGVPSYQFSSWYNDYAVYPALQHSVLVRGGFYGNAKVAGMFASLHSKGNTGYSTGYRVAIV